MANGWFIWNLKSRFFFSVVLVLFMGCHSHHQESPQEPVIAKNLESGQLVFRLGNGFFSNYFRKYASEEQKYSHLGMLSRENDSLFVYHSEASELTGVGLVKREPLTTFLEGIEVYDFYRFHYSDSITLNILDRVKAYHKDKVPFDLEFDSFHDDRLYCTELIATSVNRTMDSIVILPSLELNGRKLFALDDVYLNENVSKVVFDRE